MKVMKRISRWKCVGLLVFYCLPLAHAESEPLAVGVSVLPLEPLVRAVGGEAVEVRSLQQQGDSCSVFEPRPSAIHWLSQVDLFFRVGVGYETIILEKAESRFHQMKMVDMREAVSVIRYDDHTHDHHESCPHCGTTSNEADPHIWMDPLNLVAMADMVADHLAGFQPELGAVFKSRAEEFKARAMAVHKQLEEQLAPFHGRAVYIYHPALGYFARRYGLTQVALESSSAGSSARALHGLIKQARESGVRAVLVQPQEDRRRAEIIATAIEGDVIIIDPMRLDWEANLLEIGTALEKAFLGE